MENILAIRWRDANDVDGSARLVEMSIHRTENDALAFVKQHSKEHPELRPEICGDEGRAIGLQRLSPNGQQQNLLRTLEKEGSAVIAIPLDAGSASSALREYHSLYKAFREAGSPMSVLRSKEPIVPAKKPANRPQTN